MTVRTALVRVPVALAIALFALVGQARAQAVGSVTGMVTDQQTGQPLGGVHVSIPELGRSVLTQENGRYILLNVPVGTYTVEARMLGYATVRVENVVVATDVTRQVNIQMVTEALALEGIVVAGERVPLVELSAAGSQNTITADELAALPVSSIAGALSLQQGFLEVPSNTDVLSLGEQRRNVLSPIRIRGGRGGETLTLIDGIPVNNWVLGGRAFELNPTAAQQVDMLRGGLEPQYGNALSGVVNITTREGGTTPHGWLEVSSSRVAGDLFSWRQAQLQDQMRVQGYVSGPVPFVPGDRLRFVLSASQSSGRADVFEFDDDVFIPSNPEASTAHPFDVFPGWRAFGIDEERDVFAKLTYLVTPATKLKFTAIDYQRQYQPFDFRYLLTYDNPLKSPLIATAEDSAAYIQNTLGLLGVPMSYSDVVVNTAELNRRLFVAALDHTFSRGFVRAALGRFDQDRTTCNWFQGVCLEERFQERSFDGGFVIGAPAGKLAQNPAAGTDDVYGGEKARSYVARADVQWQATDHHNLQAGVFFQTHEIDYVEWENLNINNTQGIKNEFHVKPWEAAFYVQDRIEYDFLTLSLGFRFDYLKSPGIFFRNPLDPTNGTTAADVICNPSAWQNVRVRTFNPQLNGGLGGPEVVTMSADPSWASRLCIDPESKTINNVDDPEALFMATQIASSDDMAEAAGRTQFSPRLRVSFPVTENSSFFFNFGRYSQNPTIRNMYNYTGIGTRFEGIPQRLATEKGIPISEYTGPRTYDPTSSTTATFVGNSALVTERTTSYEVGWRAELNNTYGLTLTLFAKDQTGLTGYRQGGQLEDGTRVFDVGQTYGTARPLFGVLVNSDFQTVRGFDIQLRRRLTNYWGFDLNYSFMQTRTNAQALERQAEAFGREQQTRVYVETVSEIDQPHVFNGTLRFAVGEDAPSIPLGNALRHSSLAVTLRAASGFPYTPIFPPEFRLTGTLPTDSNLRYPLNEGRAPSTFRVDLRASKEFRIGGINYGAFIDVRNLFDRKNCVQVFPTTGDCQTGFADQDRLAQHFSNNITNIDDLTSTQFDRPQFIERRSMSVGVRMVF